MNTHWIRTSLFIKALLATAVLAAPRAARADETVATTTATTAPAAVPTVELSLKAGGHFPQLTNHLGTNFDAILKAGFGVALEKRLQLFIDFGYTQPTHGTTANDARLGSAGAGYQSDLTVRELSTMVGGQFFFSPMTSFLLPYAGLGLQLHFVKSIVTGSGGGMSFGENDETSTQVGGAAFGGLGLHLGPGMLLGELRFAYAPIGQKVTGQANIGALSVLLGYGLLL